MHQRDMFSINYFFSLCIRWLLLVQLLVLLVKSAITGLELTEKQNQVWPKKDGIEHLTTDQGSV